MIGDGYAAVLEASLALRVVIGVSLAAIVLWAWWRWTR